jgi:hypothetical protein
LFYLFSIGEIIFGWIAAGSRSYKSWVALEAAPTRDGLPERKQVEQI